MKKPAAKFVSAIFASIVATSTLSAAPDEEKPADTCLLGPSASTPPGGHWYFRVDRANKRNCWYLGQEREKAGRKAAEADAAPTEKPAPAPKKPVAQRSLTDAHAELPLAQTSAEQDTKAAVAQRAPVAPADAQRADTAQKVVTTRWPEPAAVSPPALPPPAPVARAAETQSQAQTPAAPVTPPPRPAASPAQPARATAAADKPLSLPMLLTVLAGGLSVIGVMASAIFARGKSRRGKSRPGRRLAQSAPMPPQSAPMPPLQAPEKPLPEEPRAPDDPTRRLQQMLAEIQKRAAA